ncbi:MAG: alanine--tRNA ligase-related protein, partial [Bacteroidia bacterium]|nr:alanine--tRNA ligase-related protein [Bacteroidia bacterium]
FPEVSQQIEVIQRIIRGEEESFLHTLGRGLARIENYLSTHPNIQEIPGEVAFELYDTYGFPLDLTQLIAKEWGAKVDTEGFEKALEMQKNRSRKATQRHYGDWIEINEGEHSVFVGYDTYETRTRIMRMRECKEAKGVFYHVVLDKTPFYPEGGGQVSDIGILRHGDQVLPVIHVYKEQESIIHVLSVLPRSPEVEWHAQIDIARREAVSRHHTATHLLHAALRDILGAHVRQSGSLVAPDRLRFDFTHPQKLTPEEIQEVENLVNSKINAALPRREYRDIPYEEALKKGAIALFGEKYAARVRMIEFGGSFSRELCGGTHAHNTLELRYFKILSESASAAGVRRIEAVVAQAFIQWMQSRIQILEKLQALLKNSNEPVKALENVIKEVDSLQNQLQQWYSLYAEKLIRDWKKGRGENRESIVVEEVELPADASSRNLLEALRRLHPSGTFMLLIRKGEQIEIGIAARQGANALFQQIASSIKLKGGGSSQIAVGKVLQPQFTYPDLREILAGVTLQH